MIFLNGSKVFLTQNFRRFSTHPELQALDEAGSSSPTTTTTTESSEEGSGSSDSDGSNYGWSLVYDAIVWIDAFTVRGFL